MLGKQRWAGRRHSPLHLMGRASSSDQILVNDWFGGTLPPPSAAATPSMSQGGELLAGEGKPLHESGTHPSCAGLPVT